jgi:hypothetical protein
MQLSVLYPAVDRLSIVPATAALPIPGNLFQCPANLVRVEGNSLMPDPEAAMIVDRLHLFPLAAGQLIVLPFGFQDQVRPVVQPDDEIRGILAHGSFVGVHDDKPINFLCRQYIQGEPILTPNSEVPKEQPLVPILKNMLKLKIVILYIAHFQRSCCRFLINCTILTKQRKV